MTTSTRPSLSTARGAALYIGALLGPSLLLLPGLAASIAGPASILAWLVLLGLSGLLALVFTRLGTLIPRGGGVAAYATAGLGERAGRAVAWCFLAGVVLGAPVVCLIGGTYVASLLGGGRTASVAAAAVLLVAVVALTLGGARATTAAQLVLVGLLVVLVVVAVVVGSASAARTTSWTPFAPHGWAALGRAGSVLMLSFVGWEAVAPLTARLRDPARQLPRVIGIAFAVTATVYLALAVATISVLGPRAGSTVPLADLLRVAVGSSGPLIAAIAAIALTLAATNAYISGAVELAATMRADRGARAESMRADQSVRADQTGRNPADRRSLKLQLGIAGAGVLLLGAEALGLVTTAELVTLPTTLFLTVYLGCTGAATRILAGRVRVAAGLSCVVVAGVLVFSGWALLIALVVIVSAARRPRVARPVARLHVHFDYEASGAA